MDKSNISIGKLREKIKNDSPKIIYISGKTCTGKSTFARSLKEFGYEHLELDFLVHESVKDKFNIKDNGEAFKVYKGIAPIDWQNSFEFATHKYILEKSKSSKIIVDAAIATPEVLKKIFSDELSYFMFIYLHPFDQNFYYQCIFERFTNDYKTKFRSFPLWDKATPEILEDFINNGEKSEKVMKIVRDYGDNSTKISTERFELFKKVYPNIILTGH